MKKLFSLLLVLMLAFSLVACNCGGGSDSGDGGGELPPEGDTSDGTQFPLVDYKPS